MNENEEIILQIRRYLAWDQLTSEQKYMIYLRLSKKLSYSEIKQQWMDEYGTILSDPAIKTCFKRSALGLSWEKGQSGGNSPYLCNDDFDILVQEVSERARRSKAFDSQTILDYASDLKEKRNKLAVKALDMLQCPRIGMEIQNDKVSPPDRTWIHHVLESMDAKMQYPILIEGNRFLICTPQHILSFFHKFGTLIQNTPDFLIFTVDETMMDTTRRHKVVVPSSLKRYYEKDESAEIPHMTAMCCTNLLGAGPPLHILLKNKKKIPEELKELAKCNHFSLGSTSSGWMDRWAFMEWTLVFISWLQDFRRSLGPNYYMATILLILDGHSSRECPIALELLDINHVKILVLPAHSTHILQLFDVGLAGPMKDKYTQLLHKFLNDPSKVIPNNWSATTRLAAVEAIVQAWQMTKTVQNCRAAAEAVGYSPYNPEIPKGSDFVRNYTEAEERYLNERQQRRRTPRLIINNEEITQMGMIQRIRDETTNGRDGYLIMPYSFYNNRIGDLVRYLLPLGKERNVYLLTRLPPIWGVDFFGFFQEWNY